MAIRPILPTLDFLPSAPFLKMSPKFIPYRLEEIALLTNPHWGP